MIYFFRYCAIIDQVKLFSQSVETKEDQITVTFQNVSEDCSYSTTRNQTNIKPLCKERLVLPNEGKDRHGFDLIELLYRPIWVTFTPTKRSLYTASTVDDVSVLNVISCDTGMLPHGVIFFSMIHLVV